MRSIALWVLGASLTFLITAGAFLLLANLGSESATGDPIPRADPSTPEAPPKPTLMLNLPEEQLEGLQNRPDQKLALDVENGSDEKLTNVDLSLVVISENTAHPHTRYYQDTENLAPGDTATVEFEIDLSPPGSTENREDSLRTEPQENRKILEVKVTTPDSDSAIKTAVLAP